MSTCTTNRPSATRPKAGSQASTLRFTASTFARPTSPSPTGRARRPVILPLSRSAVRAASTPAPEHMPVAVRASGRRGRAMYERPAAFTGSLRFGARAHPNVGPNNGNWGADRRARSARHAVAGVDPRRSASCGLSPSRDARRRVHHEDLTVAARQSRVDDVASSRSRSPSQPTSRRQPPS